MSVVPELYHIGVADYATARLEEIQAIHIAAGGDAAIHKQQNSLRRRTNAFMSRKRAVRLRQPQQQQPRQNIRDEKETKALRKHTRRPRWLIERHASSMLATHVWHAKRMVMIQKWGFSVADKRCDKSTSAALRAYRQACIAYDVSYHYVFKIIGTVDNIVDVFQRLQGPNAVSMEDFLDGSREVDLFLYHRFPYGLICPVRLIWTNGAEPYPMLWIHPSALEEFERTMAHYSASISLQRIEGTYCRFEVCGRKATAVLQRLIGAQHTIKKNVSRSVQSFDIQDVRRLRFGHDRQHDEHTTREDEESVVHDEEGLLQHGKPTGEEVSFRCPLTSTWHTDAQFVGHADQLLSELALWSTTDKTSDGVSFPAKIRYEAPSFLHMQSNAATATAAHWDAFRVHDNDPSEYAPNHVVNADPTRRSNCIVTIVSKRLPEEKKKDTRLPCVDGWDVIVPAERAMNIWHALIFSGARAIGLSERNAINTSCFVPSFPRDFPDTNAGAFDWHERAAELEKRHLAKPKAKRIAYGALRTESPFQPDWHTLLFAHGNETKQPFCVLRGEAFLEPFPFSNELMSAATTIPVALPTLVQVAIELPRRGIPEANAMIYLPSKHHGQSYSANTKWHGTLLEEDEEETSLTKIGYVTSAIAHHTVAFGLCHCELVQQLFVDYETRALALVRNPASRQARPCLVSILP